MYRNLIPLLAERYHIIAPDYPGFGFSEAPSVSHFLAPIQPSGNPAIHEMASDMSHSRA